MGQAPDYLTSVGLRNNATAQAREQVLTEELYALVPQDPHDEPSPAQQPPGQTVDWGNPDRWRTTRRSEPTEAIQTLVARLWPDRSDWFAIKAEYLLQARSEDGHELPNSPHSPLARELASLVEADLADAASQSAMSATRAGSHSNAPSSACSASSPAPPASSLGGAFIATGLRRRRAPRAG